MSGATYLILWARQSSANAYLFNQRMFWIVFLAALLRIVLSAHPGYIPDIGLFQDWAEKGARYGMAFIYDVGVPGESADYPPFIPYIYVGAARTMHWMTGTYTHNWIFRFLMKLPAIICDLVLVVGTYALVSRRFGGRRARFAAATVAFFPATWFLSAIWGQTDSVYTLIVSAALIALAARRMGLAGVLAGLALVTKYQALAYAPVVCGVLLVDWRRIPVFLVGFTSTIASVSFPWIVAGRTGNLWRAYANAFNAYPLVSVDALGIWNLIFLGRGDRQVDTETVAGISYKHIGLLLFGIAAVLLVTWLVRRLRESEGKKNFWERTEIMMTCAASFAIAFFIFPTQMHERYFFPFIIFALPWALSNRANGFLYLAAISVFFLNVLASFLAEPHYAYRMFGDPSLRFAFAAVFVSLSAAIGVRMWKSPAWTGPAAGISEDPISAV